MTGSVPNLDQRLENFGRRASYIDHGPGFGQAATAPLSGSKGTPTEGGLIAAAFVRYPAQIEAGTINGTFMTVMDVLPTFLEIADSEHPGASQYKGRDINGIVGRSFWANLTGEAEIVHPATDAAGWVNRSEGALIRGDYKIRNDEAEGGDGVTAWRLYNLAEDRGGSRRIAEDRGETRDLADEYPDLTAEMAAEWYENWRQR
jgi:arylsulfatase A-like enzyme